MKLKTSWMTKIYNIGRFTSHRDCGFMVFRGFSLYTWHLGGIYTIFWIYIFTYLSPGRLFVYGTPVDKYLWGIDYHKEHVLHPSPHITDNTQRRCGFMCMM